MAVINISLVGGQSMPVYQGFKEPVVPDKIILICSSKSFEEAKEIGNKSNKPFELKQFDAFNYSSILKGAETLLDSLKEEKVIINITGGTKPWAVGFTLMAINRDNCTLIYFDQNGVMRDLTHQYLENASQELDIATILRYNNQPIPSHTSFSDYTEQDTNILNSVIKLRSLNYEDFKHLTLFLDQSWKRDFENLYNPQPRHSLPSGSRILYDRSLNTVHIKLFKNNRYGGFEEKHLSSPHVDKIVFNTGWFEYEVALMMSKWNHSKEIWMNVTFPYNNNDIKNEIDILVSTGNKLLFIECKTQIKDTTDIDKFRSAVRNYGRWSSKALFITRGKMTPFAKEKCKDNDILCFSFQDTLSDERARRERLSLDEVRERRGRELFNLLNAEMLNSNT